MNNNYQKIIYIKKTTEGSFRRPGFLVLLFLALSFNAIAQSKQTVSLNLKNVQISVALDVIQKQIKSYIVYNHEQVNSFPKVTIKVKDQPLDKTLEQLLGGSGLSFNFKVNTIVIGPKKQQGNPNSSKVSIAGEVYDEKGDRLFKATILELETKNGTLTDDKGRFNLNVDEDAVLLITYLGMEPQRIQVAGRKSLKIEMKPANLAIDEVVVTGIPYNRRTESFTGSATRITRQELMRAGNLNVFQSLKSVEPSLNIQDNMSFGSDPNKRPEMQIRGASSFPDIKGQYATDPNQPLFIVDGFEMTIEKVSDLDINRIEAITILKDASAKALYGSRAANGVVVIETVKVKPGELRVSYTGTYGFELPDLSSYNLTNAAEKLELERQLGAYSRTQPIFGLPYDSLFYANLKQVQRGVNTDWLAQPVRTGFSNKQTLGFEVGDDRLRTGLTLSMGKIQGVMKGSERQNLSGAFSVSYRFKNILFSNQLQYTNVKAKNSPYGEFSEYAKLNPYWQIYNADGSLRKFLGLGPVHTQEVFNPMYNATLNGISTTDYTDLTNNTYLEWTASKDIKVIGRIGFTNTVNGSDEFLPASHTKFADYTGENFFKKGSYDKGNGKATMISGDLNMNYSKIWGKHVLFTNIGLNIREDNSESYLYSAVGFPNSRMDNIIFAKQYADNSKPAGSESINREVGGLAIANYSFDNRYFADVSIRSTASSQFGSNNRWGSFWAAGAGWNIHNEKFLSGNDYVQQLKLRGSVGYTGSQNFNSYQAMLLYNYFLDNSYQGQLGTYLNGLSNPDLKWQQKLDYNFGLDATLLNNLSIRFDLYRAITNNLLTDITTPPSIGFSSYKANLGKIENTGLDFRVNYRMMMDNAKRQSLNLYVNGVANRNKIVEISNSLKGLSDDQDKLSRSSNVPLVRFEEGQSLDAIWAVRSNGIDPATGEEIFVKRDGTLTTVWDANDKVVVGINQPKVYGNIGANFERLGFSVGFIANFKLGGQIYNQTLVNKVENAQLNYNVDARAYYDSWKKPGDHVLFKSIGTSNSLTLATSRFVQDLNELNISAVNIGYDFYRHPFVKKMNLQRLQVMLNANDLLRVSTVGIERGIAYPFARYYTLTLMANF